MTDLPEPLTPPNCDLSDFNRMMIDIPRLRQSEFDAELSDSIWRAGFNLWLSSWHSVPAGSLDDNDAALAKAASLGRDVRGWKKVRAGALRSWVKCSDGRLYHPTVAELALESWIEKLLRRRQGAVGNSKRWGGDADVESIEADLSEAARLLRRLNPDSKHIAKVMRKSSPGDPPATADNIPPRSREDHESVPPRSREDKKTEVKAIRSDQKTGAKTSQETGTGTGIIDSPPASQAPQGGAPGAADGEAKRGTRLPADWALTPALIAYAATCGYSEHETRFIAHRFENHWRAATGAKACKRDWDRTFQNWVTNENRRQVREGAAAWRNGAPADERAARERVWREDGVWNPKWGPKPDEPGYAEQFQ